MRAAVITPYYREETSILERCHKSVLDQDYECTHFLVADGFPIPEVDRFHCEHIKLSKSHNDNGNTPRAIGCLSAMNQGYNVIFLLDADNWFMRNHVSSAVMIKLINPLADIVAMQRQILLPDGTAVPDPKEDLDGSHLDTSCFVFFESSYSILPLWAMMPPFLGPICDRVMFQLIQAKGLHISWNDSKTLFFTSNYSQSYLSVGHPLPSRVNDPDIYFINNKLQTHSKQVIDRIGFHIETSILS